MTLHASYPIGTPGRPWGAEEVAAWRSRQSRKRSFEADVQSAIERLRARFDVVEYGRLDYPPDSYPLFAIKSRAWRDELPCALVTGGVHGYETSGVHGALQFVDRAYGAATKAGSICSLRPASVHGLMSGSIAGTRMPSIRTARSATTARRRNRPR